MSNEHLCSFPPKKVGFFCFRCRRDDFGINQKSLSAHVRYCAPSKRKSNNQPSGPLHSSGTSPYPFLVKRSCVHYEDAFEFADIYCNKRNNSDAYPYPDDVIFDMDCVDLSIDEDDIENVEYFHQLTEVTDGTDLIHHLRRFSASTPLEDAALPYNLTCSLPPSSQFQLDLLSTLSKHRIDLNLHNEIIDVIKQHSSDHKLHFSSDTLQNRIPFLKKMESNLHVSQLKPKDILVNLNGGGKANVAVFNLKAMILSLLLDDNLMRPKNIAEGFDIFTGKGSLPDDVYGEIHTGDAWEPAREHFCGDDPCNMPVALIIFGDKSHLDLHRSLSTLPLTFTLSLFNEKSRNRSELWQPLSFIPNLSYGATSSKNSAKPNESQQDEHNCLKVSLSSIVDIHKSGGISTTVMGIPVILKVWIHYFVGDTSGNNHWQGHFNGSGMLTCPY
jgi:hypothetical protein